MKYQSLCDEISTSVNNLMTENEKLSNINTLLVTRVTEPEEEQVKMEQYRRRNNVEISGISNEVSDENVEGKVVETGIDFKLFDIEGCHRLPPGCINISNSKPEIVRVVNKKHSEAMLRLKESINSRCNVFVTYSLRPYYYCFLCGQM